MPLALSITMSRSGRQPLGGSAAFWQHLDGPDNQRRAWRLTAILFAASSAGHIFNLSTLIPGVPKVVPAWVLSNTYVLILGQLGILGLIWRRKLGSIVNVSRWPYAVAVLIAVAILHIAGLDPDRVVQSAFPYLLVVFLL